MQYNSWTSLRLFEDRKKFEDLTASEISKLEEENIFNGCGGKGGLSFDEILEMVEKLEYFDKEKFKKFHTELKEQGCKPHDYKYWIGGKWYHKFLADLALSNWIFMNLQWTEWYITLAAWLWSMVGLTKQWNKYFNFS